ncbi:TonB-dependent receptor [Nitrosococcus halophilus Nc 4]|uniref:TonB-dependent receptor n=2 Tax=Nitrosococcus halophilus TaxID=133539 RepID=D5BWN4_NITHN|nr:TonB-dependent receptor [Nitrosococcus halophilus Nc 4]
MVMLRFLYVLLMTLLLLPSVKAQQAEEEVMKLEAVTVTADPLGSTGEHIVQPNSVLKGKELLIKDKQNIGEAVADEIGVTSSDFGPAVGRPIIRGLGGARVRILEDGIGTLDVSNISPDHAVAIEPLFADQIEIFRGPATLLYGSGASGGLVNVVNHRILDYVPEGIEGDLYGHYNSVADDATGAFRFNGGIGNFAFHVDGLLRDTNDYDIPGFSDIQPEPGARSGTLANSDVQTENFAGGFSLVGDPGFLGFAISRFTNEYGVPGGHEHEEDEGEAEHEHEEAEGGVRIDQAQTRFDIKGALYEPLPGIQTVKTRWGYNDHTHKEFEPSGVASTILDNKEWEGRVEFLHVPFGLWDGVLGLQYRNRDLSTSGEEAFVPSSQLDSLSVFVLEKRDWQRWHFEVGGRFEHQEAERARDRQQASHDLFNLSGGAIWEFWQGYSVGVNISHSQRAPALEELFSEGPHLATNTFEIGDISLDKEISNNFDLSFRKTHGHWNWTLNLFANFINDFIFLQERDQNGDGVADRVNLEGELVIDPEALLLVNQRQADAEFFGVEFETVLGLFDDHRGKLDLRLWTDYVSGELSEGSNLPRITPLRFGSELDYERGPWYTGINIMRVQRQEDTALLETETKGYSMLSVHMGYQLALGPVQYTIFLRGTNLLDEEARRHTSFLKNQAPLPGRSAMVGITATF